MRQWIYIGALILLCSLSANLIQHFKIEDFKNKIPYYYSDQPLVDRAIHIYAQETRQKPKSVLEHRFPAVVRTRDQTCVNLFLPRGTIGSMPVYCFDNDSGRLTYQARL
jgi:hypothetical protein